MQVFPSLGKAGLIAIHEDHIAVSFPHQKIIHVGGTEIVYEGDLRTLMFIDNNTLCGSAKNVIFVVEVASKIIRWKKMMLSTVWSISVSPNRQNVVVGGMDGDTHVFFCQDGSFVSRHIIQPDIRAFASVKWIDNDRYIKAISNGTIMMCPDSGGWGEVRISMLVRFLFLSPCQTMIFVGDFGRLVCFDMLTMKERWRYEDLQEVHVYACEFLKYPFMALRLLTKILILDIRDGTMMRTINDQGNRQCFVTLIVDEDQIHFWTTFDQQIACFNVFITPGLRSLCFASKISKMLGWNVASKMFGNIKK